MAINHASLSLFAIVFMAGSVAMHFFVILSAVTPVIPLRHTYFLRADTSGITGARPVSQWTYFYICGEFNTDCGNPVAALPVGRAWSTNPSGAPDGLVGPHDGGTTSRYYWYMWRFGWIFYLIALFFEICALAVGVFACFGRLGSAIAGLASSSALVFSTGAVALMTATFIKMRNAFHAAGRDASLGNYGFGFAWGSWAALLISTLLFFWGVRGHQKSGKASTAATTEADVSKKRFFSQPNRSNMTGAKAN